MLAVAVVMIVVVGVVVAVLNAMTVGVARAIGPLRRERREQVAVSEGGVRMAVDPAPVAVLQRRGAHAANASPAGGTVAVHREDAARSAGVPRRRPDSRSGEACRAGRRASRRRRRFARGLRCGSVGCPRAPRSAPIDLAENERVVAAGVDRPIEKVRSQMTSSACVSIDRLRCISGVSTVSSE
jgi:hypothetical protein